jgi:ADP-heptose:LPS heptosyltransferase
VENNFALLQLLGAEPQLEKHHYEIYLTPEEDAWALDYLAHYRLTGHRLLGVHVGSGGTKNLPLRRWPVGHYTDLINQIIRARPDAAVLLFGGPDENAAHEEILKWNNSPLVIHPDTPNIRLAAALLKHCRAFLSVDTVFMHLAAAMGVPKQVVIETPTFNPTVEPYGQPYKLVKNPGVDGRNFQFYRYDGRDIQGTPEQLRQIMESVTLASVYVAANKALD